MQYETIYNNLIQKRQREVPEGYTEEHHITPKSFGGSDTKDNLVRLTAREHYLAHYLLLKMQKSKTDRYYSALSAFFMMQVDNGTGLRYMPSYKFDNLRNILSENRSFIMSGDKNPILGKIWICNPDLGENIIHDPSIPIPEGYYTGQNKVKKICPVCGKVFIAKPRFNVCSESCRHSNRFPSVKSKLSVDIAWSIRTSDIYKDMTVENIAKLFGVSRVTIVNIRLYDTYNYTVDEYNNYLKICEQNDNAFDVYKKPKVVLPKIRKKRTDVGVYNHSAKLNAIQVTEIKSAQLSYYAGQDDILAKKYNVGRDVIGRIRRGKRYK